MKNRKTPPADLRSKYVIHLETSLIVALLLCIAAFRAQWQPTETTIDVALGEQEVIQLDQVLATEQLPNRPPPPPLPPVPVEVPDATVLEDEAISFDATLDIAEPVPVVGPPPPPPEPVVVEPEEEPEDEVFVVVEQMPELIGGVASIQQHLEYPELARRAGIEGRVYVQFIVDENGRPTEPEVIRGIGGGCDEEAVRTIMNYGQFIPGKQRGKPVRVRMSIPVHFQLKKHA